MSIITAAAETTSAGTDPFTLVVSSITAIILAIIGLLQFRAGRASKETNKKIEETQAVVKEVERKTTSNHGNDNLGDKTDMLFDSVNEMTEQVKASRSEMRKMREREDEKAKLLDKLVNMAIRNRGDIEGIQTDIEELKMVTRTTTTNIADNTIVVSEPINELNIKMDEVLKKNDK